MRHDNEINVMDNETAVKYLESLLGRTLRAHITDGVSSTFTDYAARPGTKLSPSADVSWRVQVYR